MLLHSAVAAPCNSKLRPSHCHVGFDSRRGCQWSSAFVASPPLDAVVIPAVSPSFVFAKDSFFSTPGGYRVRLSLSFLLVYLPRSLHPSSRPVVHRAKDARERQRERDRERERQRQRQRQREREIER